MDVPEIDVTELAARQADGVTIIDVRNQDEYDEAHASGVVLIPLPEFADRFGEVPTDGPIYVICAAGGRSLKACEFLATKGIEATNIAGGTKAWIAAGLPTDAGADQ